MSGFTELGRELPYYESELSCVLVIETQGCDWPLEHAYCEFNGAEIARGMRHAQVIS